MNVKQEKMETKGIRIRNNALYRQDERQFYTNINESTSRTENVPVIDELVEFRAGI